MAVVKWICWGLIVWYTMMSTNDYDALFLLVFCVAIVLAFSNQSIDAGIYGNKVVSFLGRFSLPLYLNHRYFAFYLGEVIPESWGKMEQLGIYIAASVIAASAVMFLSAICRKCYNPVKKGIKKFF